MEYILMRILDIILLSLCLLLSSTHARTSSFYTTSLRNVSLYPPCAEDSDCSSERKCFQYMCYPHSTTTGFRWCDKHSDCQELTPNEEGDGSNGLCFRHPDKQNIRFGICLKKIETKHCYSHSDCPRHLRCVNGWCGDKSYFEALKHRECEDDYQCEQLLTGEMCCYDLSAAEWWAAGEVRWSKRCCDNPSGHPVTRPDKPFSPQHLSKLDKGISSLAPMFLDAVICEGIDYQMMTQLESCQLYTTTTTTTDRYASQHTSAATNVVQDMISNSLVVMMTLTKWL